MALAHKGLIAERVAWRFSQKEQIKFSGQGSVPVLVDGIHTVSDSWKIAVHLENRYPDKPSLFGGDAAVSLTRFINDWADATLIPGVAQIVVLDVHNKLSKDDQPYFRSTRERRFGMNLEAVVADRDSHISAFRRSLAPLRMHFARSPYLAGASPMYADYCVFGFFMWLRCSTDVDVLEKTDPIYEWRDKLLDAFEGMARSARCAVKDGTAITNG